MELAVVDDTFQVLELEIAGGDEALAVELLAGLEVPYSTWTDAEGRRTMVRIYAEAAEADARFAQVVALLQEVGELLSEGVPAVRRESLRREDWSETWKKHFHPFRASSRLVVKPSWESFQAGAGDIVLEIDPGMAFGTGQHGTTRACLEYLDELASRLGPVPMLDAGCGSGILTLAAMKLGFRPVYAFDYDPEAVRMASENLARGGVVGTLPACADLADYRPPTPCRVVVANILAPVLMANGGRLLSFLDRDAPGYLVLSGILTGQFDEVAACFVGLGAHETSRRTLDEWTSGCFEV